MQKHKTIKLALKSQTIRTLTRKELHQALGGEGEGVHTNILSGPGCDQTVILSGPECYPTNFPDPRDPA